MILLKIEKIKNFQIFDENQVQPLVILVTPFISVISSP